MTGWMVLAALAGIALAAFAIHLARDADGEEPMFWAVVAVAGGGGVLLVVYGFTGLNPEQLAHVVHAFLSRTWIPL